jgi:putative SOS response-associated peptidase YedK
MCGRFTNSIPPKKIWERFGLKGKPSSILPRYNIAPTQEVPVIVSDENSKMISLEMYRWGLIPFWAKEAKIGNRMINTRAETVAEKPSYRRPFLKQRCLIPADGFYEWQKVQKGKNKLPFFISLKNKEPFAFAGLWDQWKDETGKPVFSFTILTTDSNDLLRSIHDRMPVILDPKNEPAWLDTEFRDSKTLKKMLTSYPSEKMQTYEVSSLVNIPTNDSPECTEPIPSEA